MDVLTVKRIRNSDDQRIHQPPKKEEHWIHRVTDDGALYGCWCLSKEAL